MASVHNRCNTCDDHTYSQQDALMLKQQLNAVLQENIRSHIEHNIINISIDENPKIRTITKQKQDDINVELNPHVKRVKQWDDDMTYLAKKFAVYCEMNQLKEQILGIKETPKNPEEKIDLTIFDNDGFHLCNDDEKKIEITVEEIYEPFDDEKHMETRDLNINEEYTMGHDDGYYELDGSILLRQY
eukprot:223525_1